MRFVNSVHFSVQIDTGLDWIIRNGLQLLAWKGKQKKAQVPENSDGLKSPLPLLDVYQKKTNIISCVPEDMQRLNFEDQSIVVVQVNRHCLL